MKKTFFIMILTIILLLPVGANAADIDYSWERWCSGNCTLSYTFTVDNLNGATAVSPILTLTGDADQIEVVSVEGADGWNATNSREGNKITMNFTREGATTSNNLGTLTLKLKNYNTNYSAQLELDGSVITIAEASSTTTNDGELTNPDTGAFINYGIIVGGLGISAIIILLSKKNKKLYKI